jgi:SnoaL-like domain
MASTPTRIETARGLPPQGPLLQEAVQAFAARWYQALDRHDDVESVLEYLIDEGLEMRFPEATARGHSGFRDWYQAVTHRFFDEVHTVREVSVTGGTPDAALARVVVNWQAKIWNPPDATSQWLGFDAYQTWTVVPGPGGALQVAVYVVDELRPMPGSAQL